MGRRNRERRQQRLERERAATPVVESAHAPLGLRLVRSEQGNIPGEQVSARLPYPPVDRVPDQERSDGHAPQAANGHHVVAPTASEPIRATSDLVRRSFDANEINPILNDPSVFKYAAHHGFEHLDVSGVIADPRNVLLMAKDGGILCAWQEPGIYEVHTNFLTNDAEREAREPTYTRDVCLGAYRWMFTHTDCLYLLTRIPSHNRVAAWLAPRVGWTKEFERKDAWVTVDGDLIGVSYYALRYDDWVRKTPDLMRVGREFHARLESEFKRHGHAEKPHPDEDCHDLHVGACVEMIQGGQLEKAVAFYNRWARFAGYGLIGMVSRAPVVIDIGSAILHFDNGTVRVALVR